MDMIRDIPLPKPDIRSTEDMRSVLYNAADAEEDRPLYFMYRALFKNEDDAGWLISHKIRYDITEIPPGEIGGEYVKTKGHYHPDAPDGFGYPELYQVLSGSAHYLLQKKDLSEFILVCALAGDFVLIPPGYGHVTINPTDDTLIMANLVSDNFSSEYQFYEDMHGAAWYETEEGWIKNPAYDNVLELKVLERPKEYPEYGIIRGRNIYGLIGTDYLEFLNKPSLLNGNRKFF